MGFAWFFGLRGVSGVTDDDVGSLAEELQLLAVAIGTQDPDSPDSVLGMIRQYVGDFGTTNQHAPDVQRIDLS